MSMGGWAQGQACADLGARAPIGLNENFEGYSANMCAEKFPLVSMGGLAEGLACADLGARAPIGASGNFAQVIDKLIRLHYI